MAYDESAHLGLIRIYAHRWLPFWSQTPPGAEVYGAIARDPSYLYHYLLSFPYRLLAHFVHTDMAQVLCLRLVSIVGFIIGLVVARKLLMLTDASKTLVHVVLALLILTPIVPFISAQLNYDSIFFPLTAGALLLTIKIISALKNKRLPLLPLLGLWSLGLSASLVKYAFLPLLGLITVWVGAALVRYTRAQSASLAQQLRSAAKQTRWPALIGMIVLTVITSGLFVERYGLNLARYHNPLPSCEKVMSEARCMANGPWRRNYNILQDKQAGRLRRSFLAPGTANPIHYTLNIWLYTMSRQLFYTLNGEASFYEVGQPFVLPVKIGFSLAIGGAVLLLWYQRRLRRQYRLDFLIGAVIIYAGSLWALNYSDFYHLGLAVALQVRYLLPILPIIYLLLALGYRQLLRNRPAAKVLLGLAFMAILLFEGGGASVFILRSNPSWYWPNHAVQQMNHSAQIILKKFVIGA